MFDDISDDPMMLRAIELAEGRVLVGRLDYIAAARAYAAEIAPEGRSSSRLWVWLDARLAWLKWMSGTPHVAPCRPHRRMINEIEAALFALIEQGEIE